MGVSQVPFKSLPQYRGAAEALEFPGWGVEFRSGNLGGCGTVPLPALTFFSFFS